MNVVAIVDLAGERQQLADGLAKALGLTRYEALQRISGPAGTGPLVAGVFAERGQAENLLGRLVSGGFRAMLLTDEDMRAESGMRSAKTFHFGENEFQVEFYSSSGAIAPLEKVLSLPYPGIRLIVRGTRTSTGTSVETSMQRKLSLGRAVLSGGLVFSKKEKTVRETATGRREGFANLYAGGGLCVTLLENGLRYESLGPALGFSNSANFSYLVGELRRRCRQARYDERLLNKFSQSSMLGPLLDPAQYPYVATALISRALLE